ncbi:MAG: glycosyltransferase family 2 protein [Silicimonas sp.]|nr:glycosyltransferase family 2 protein [Silicimonas sp.]
MSTTTSLLVATVKNEGPNILEWVAHHRLCGFDCIQIYQNDSTDNTVKTLRTLARMGVIEYFDNRHDGGAHQRRAYRRAARSAAYGAADHCMVLDGDEFLNIRIGSGRIDDLIAACPEETDGILVNWRVFGSSGHQTLSRDLVTERFTRAEPADAITDSQLSPFKTLFRTASFQHPGIHLPRGARKPDLLLANGSGLIEGEFQRKNWRSFDPGARALAQINHYATRDLASFLLKFGRDGAPRKRNEGEAYWAQHDQNAEADQRLADRAPALWDEMRALDEASGGVLLRLRKRAYRQWHIALETLLEDPGIRALQTAILARTPQPEPETEEPLQLATPFRLPAPPVLFSSVRRGPSGVAAE